MTNPKEGACEKPKERLFRRLFLYICSLKGDMSRNARSCENGEFGENLPKSLTKANELARRVSSKAANVCRFRQIRHIRRFRQGPSSKLICICGNIWQNFAKFAGFAKFIMFAAFAKSLGKILSNLSFSPLCGRFCQIRHIRRFRHKPWQNFVKFVIFTTVWPVLPNSPYSPLSPKALAKSCQICHFRDCVHFWT